MRIGKNQALVLAHVAKHGGKGFALSHQGHNGPWQLERHQYRRVLASLEAKDLIRRLDSGAMRIELRVGAVSQFTSDFEVTPLGEAHLS